MSKRAPTPKNPARDWLLSLEWDGKKRLGKWLRRVLNDRDKSSRRHRRYIDLVGRNVVTAHAARVINPGTKFDHAVVLAGTQGLRKSTLISTLVGVPRHCDAPLDPRSFNMAELPGVWAYELCELSAFSRADAMQLKSFIDRSHDTYRAAFGQKITPNPRQFVIWATSCESNIFMGQESLQRRFWPVKVSTQPDIAWLQRNRSQLFAEAVVRYKAGKRFTPSALQEMRVFGPEQVRWARKDGAA